MKQFSELYYKNQCQKQRLTVNSLQHTVLLKTKTDLGSLNRDTRLSQSSPVIHQHNTKFQLLKVIQECTGNVKIILKCASGIFKYLC